MKPHGIAAERAPELDLAVAQDARRQHGLERRCNTGTVNAEAAALGQPAIWRSRPIPSPRASEQLDGFHGRPKNEVRRLHNSGEMPNVELEVRRDSR